MKKSRLFILICLSLLLVATAPHVQAASWTREQAEQLRTWIDSAPEDALPVLDHSRLDAALRNGDKSSTDEAATALALCLARMHLLGGANSAQRAGWRIEDSDSSTDIEGWLERALAADALDGFFRAVRPRHPEYAALRSAYASEDDQQRRITLARNMERWRWLPRSLGQDYVLVNQALFEAQLWRDGKKVGTWPVIVGKPSTPTPVFSTTITGVILNPWWNIPASIVREMRGRFPASKGYVYSNGSWRQKPGPNNALGQMKLVMPNRFSVYMHDTPSKHLFQRDVRAFSHGCIRTGDALGFAATLLDGVKSREQIDSIVASNVTTKIDLPVSLPVYVTYFTAGIGQSGAVTIQPDIYGRDGRLAKTVDSNRSCDT